MIIISGAGGGNSNERGGGNGKIKDVLVARSFEFSPEFLETDEVRLGSASSKTDRSVCITG